MTTAPYHSHDSDAAMQRSFEADAADAAHAVKMVLISLLTILLLASAITTTFLIVKYSAKNATSAGYAGEKKP